jgi:hypothetical protein
MGVEIAAALKLLATLIAEKNNQLYSHTIGLLRARLSFALLRSAIICLRGSHCRPNRGLDDLPADVIISEARVAF